MAGLFVGGSGLPFSVQARHNRIYIARLALRSSQHPEAKYDNYIQH